MHRESAGISLATEKLLTPKIPQFLQAYRVVNKLIEEPFSIPVLGFHPLHRSFLDLLLSSLLQSGTVRTAK